MRTGGADVSGDTAFATLRDTDFAGLQPMVCVMAECDPFAANGSAYAEAIRAAGGKAVSFEEKGLVHGYLRARHTVGRARESYTRIVDAVRALGRGEWPY
ncbi:Carboxylesterase NlhH [Rhizobiaceae bacterium]|nr:Carboxylesterase NlhH [Rhizobiaceae bacterium]